MADTVEINKTLKEVNEEIAIHNAVLQEARAAYAKAVTPLVGQRNVLAAEANRLKRYLAVASPEEAEKMHVEIHAIEGND